MRSLLTILCLYAPSAHAVPGQFTHQGRLLADDGTPMTGDVTITFRVANAETGGTALWEETQELSLTNGFYAAVLGANEETNPLDTDVLQQTPVWLELQLAGEGAMYPRSPIHAVPYATISTVAGSVSGGPVNATEIAVDGTTVVDGSGNWVGPAPTIEWDDIDGVPDDAFDALAVSCEAGEIPVLDAGSGMWVCGWDNDSLADIACTDGQLIKWSDASLGFVCAGDVDTDTQLTADEVDAIVADNGYAMAADVFSGSYEDLSDKPSLFSGSFSDITDMPTGLSDGIDNDTLGDLPCADEQVAAFDAEDGTWKCTSLTSLQLPEAIEPIPALSARLYISLRDGIFGGGFRTSIQAFMPTTGGRYTTLQLFTGTASSGDELEVAIYGPSPDGSTSPKICGTTHVLTASDADTLLSLELGTCNLTAHETHYIGIFDSGYTDLAGIERSYNTHVAWRTDSYRTFIPDALDIDGPRLTALYGYWFRLLP